jgi:hypothetical protein
MAITTVIQSLDAARTRGVHAMGVESDFDRPCKAISRKASGLWPERNHATTHEHLNNSNRQEMHQHGQQPTCSNSIVKGRSL